jgi:hypothetical protein
MVGIAAIVEMIYHIQLNAALGPVVPFLGPAGHAGGRQLGRGRSSCCSPASGLFEVTRRRYAQWGDDPGRNRARNQAPGGSMSAERAAPWALELKDLRKSFGKTDIIRGVDLQVPPASASRSSGPTAPASRRCST